jgi:hypothetical protein
MAARRRPRPAPPSPRPRMHTHTRTLCTPSSRRRLRPCLRLPPGTAGVRVRVRPSGHLGRSCASRARRGPGVFLLPARVVVVAIHTQKKQKCLLLVRMRLPSYRFRCSMASCSRFSVPRDRLFLDALERDLKHERIGQEPTTTVMDKPVLSLTYDPKCPLYEQFSVARRRGRARDRRAPRRRALPVVLAALVARGPAERDARARLRVLDGREHRRQPAPAAAAAHRRRPRTVCKLPRPGPRRTRTAST